MTYVHKGPPISYRWLQLILFLPQPIPPIQPSPRKPTFPFPPYTLQPPFLDSLCSFFFLLTIVACSLQGISYVLQVFVCVAFSVLWCVCMSVCNCKFLCVQILFSQSALMPVSRWVTHQTIEDPRQGTDNTIIKKSFSFLFV